MVIIFKSNTPTPPRLKTFWYIPGKITVPKDVAKGRSVYTTQSTANRSK